MANYDVSYEHKMGGAADSEPWHQMPLETVLAVSDVLSGAALFAKLERLICVPDPATAQIRTLRIRR